MGLVRTLLCGVFFFGALTYSQVAFADNLPAEIQNLEKKTDSLFQQAITFLSQYQKDRAFRESLQNPDGMPAQEWKNKLADLFEKADTLLGEASELIPSLDTALHSVLDRFDTQSGKRLGALKAEFAATLGAFRGSSEISERNKRREDDSFYDRLGPWLAPVVRAHVLEGGRSLDPVVELLELSVGTPVLMKVRLGLSQVSAVVEYLKEELQELPTDQREWPLPRTSQENYESIRSDLEREMARLHTIFPGLPALDRNRVQNAKDLQLLNTELGKFEQSLTKPGSALFRAHHDRIKQAIISVFQAVSNIQGFSTEAFPALSRDEDSTRLTMELLSNPRYAECSSLGHASVGEGYVRSDIFEGPACDIQSFPTALKSYMDFHEKQAGYGILPALLELMGNFESQLLAGKISWKEIESKATKNFEQLGSLNGWTLPAWLQIKKNVFSKPEELQKRLGQGLELHDYLATKFQEAGVDPLLGVDMSFTPTLFAAKDEIQLFQNAVPAGAQKIDRLSATSDCRAFNAHSVAKSPYVVWTEKLVPISAEEDRWTDTSPSTQGFQRLVWGHKIRVGNAVNLRRTEYPDRLLAGSLKWTALSRYIPNLVLLRMFNGAVIKDGAGLDAIGVRDGSTDFGFAREKGSPPWEKVIAESRTAFSQMLQDFKTHNEDLISPEAAQNEGTVRALFRERYRQELVLAAKEMRRWGDRFEKINTSDTHEDRYQAIQQVPKHELCTLFGLSALQCPPGIESPLHMSLMRDLFPKIKENYFKRHPELPKNGDFTPDMFMEELVMHRGVIGGDKPVTGLEGAEIPRYKYYVSNWITQEIYVSWATQISKLQKIHEHTQNVYERPKAQLESMRAMLFHLFPPLRVQVAVAGTGESVPAWKWLEDDAAQFERVMQAYTQEAATLINQIQALDTEKEVLDFLLPVLPLVDQTLRFFPENKTQVCSEYGWRGFWKGTEQGSMAIAEVAASASMGLGPVGVAVGAGIFAVALTVDYQRLQQERAELARNKAHELASWSQVSLGTSAQTTRVVDQMDRAYGADVTAFYVRTGLTGAFAGYSALKNLAVLGRVPGAIAQGNKAYLASMRTASWKKIRSAKPRIRLAAMRTGMKTGRGFWRQILSRLERQGVTSRSWPHRSLAERWNNPLLTDKRWGVLRPVVNVPGAVVPWAFHYAGNLPFSFFRRTAGSGVLGMSYNSYVWASLATLTLGYVQENFNLAWKELAWDALKRDPYLYEPLMLRLMNGEMSPDALRAVVAADQKYRAVWEDAFKELVAKQNKNEIPVEAFVSEVKALRDAAEKERDRAGSDDRYIYPRQRLIHHADELLRNMERTKTPAPAPSK